MLMLIFVLTAMITSAFTGYAGSSSGSYGNGVSGGYGYGYGEGSPPDFAQFFQHVPFDFNSLFKRCLNHSKEYPTRAIAYTSISIDPPFRGTVSAHSRIIFDGISQIQQQVQNAAGFAGNYGFPGNYPGYSGSGTFAGSYNGHSGGGQSNFVPSGGYGGGYVPAGRSKYDSNGNGRNAYGAGAFASIGGDNVQQSAFLNPENPNYPNVNVRFGSSPPPTQGGGGGGGGGSYSVFTSSSSRSGNVNGKPVNFRYASTTVNDNGKIRTYSVHDRK